MANQHAAGEFPHRAIVLMSALEPIFRSTFQSDGERGYKLTRGIISLGQAYLITCSLGWIPKDQNQYQDQVGSELQTFLPDATPLMIRQALEQLKADPGVLFTSSGGFKEYAYLILPLGAQGIVFIIIHWGNPLSVHWCVPSTEAEEGWYDLLAQIFPPRETLFPERILRRYLLARERFLHLTWVEGIRTQIQPSGFLWSATRKPVRRKKVRRLIAISFVRPFYDDQVIRAVWLILFGVHTHWQGTGIGTQHLLRLLGMSDQQYGDTASGLYLDLIRRTEGTESEQDARRLNFYLTAGGILAPDTVRVYVPDPDDLNPDRTVARRGAPGEMVAFPFRGRDTSALEYHWLRPHVDTTLYQRGPTWMP